jgi:D-amino peptidase
VFDAIAHRSGRQPFTVSHPVTLEMTFKNYMPSEVLGYLRSIERVDAHTIRFVGRDMQEIADFVDFVENYSADLSP